MAVAGSNGPRPMSNAEFQAWLSGIREAASAQAVPASAPEPRSSAQMWCDYGFDSDRPRPRPPFDAKQVVADLGVTHAENELVRRVTADVVAQVAAQRAAGQRA